MRKIAFAVKNKIAGYWAARLWLFACVLLGAGGLAAQTCTTATEMAPANKSALEAAATRYLQAAAAGDMASLRAEAIPALASDFNGVAAAVTQNQTGLKAGKSTISGVYSLQAEGSAPLARVEFYCGIFNSQDRTTFVIPNLPPGRYGVVIQSLSGDAPLYFTTILNQQGDGWKLAGLTVKGQKLGSRDAEFFLSKAREFQAKGQNLMSWFFYVQGWELLEPVNFMYTPRRDRVADEMQKVKPAELPSAQTPLRLTAGGKAFAVTDLFPEIVDIQGRKDLYLIVKYRAITDVNDTNQTFEANRGAIQAVLAQYPDLRTSFDGVVARAVDPSGRDYGTLLAMKDIK